MKITMSFFFTKVLREIIIQLIPPKSPIYLELSLTDGVVPSLSLAIACMHCGIFSLTLSCLLHFITSGVVAGSALMHLRPRQ